MAKVYTVVGARPEFIKSGTVSSPWMLTITPCDTHARS